MAPNTVTSVLGDATFIASFQGGAQAVATWLDEGGCVDARIKGATLLMAAAAGGQEAIVRMLLQRGASVNLQNFRGRTALMDAAGLGHTMTVQALLDAKADVSLQKNDGSTALVIAEQEEHTVTAALLRQHAKPQAPGRPHDFPPVSGPLSGRRVRIAGLKGRPELNGRSGVAAHFDAAKGRYAVTVEGEAEAVLLKPANLQEILESDPSAVPLTLNPSPGLSPSPGPNLNPDPM